MTRDDIIRMALEHFGAVLKSSDLEVKLAALAVAAEREACAEVAESYEPTCDTCPSGVANAIRARGEA